MAATFPKDAFAWIEGGVKSLANTGQDRPHAASAPYVVSTDGLQSGAEPETEPSTKLDAAGVAVTAPACATDRALNSARAYAGDRQPVLGRDCRMDTASTAEGLEFTIEVPGLKDTDLSIRMLGDTIVVSGRLDLDRAEKTYSAVEREVGPFSRSIQVPEGVQPNRIQAWLNRGVLTVFVPNPTVQVGKTIAVNSALHRTFESDDGCELKIDLPGVDEADLDLTVRNGTLTISRHTGPQSGKANDQAGNKSPPRLLHSMELHAGVDVNQIRAVLAKGVLTVTLPIAAGHRHRIIPLETADETVRPEPISSDIGSEPALQADRRRQSEAPVDAPRVSPLYFSIGGMAG